MVYIMNTCFKHGMAWQDNCFIGYYKYLFDVLIEKFSRVNHAGDGYAILNLKRNLQI